MVCGVVAIRMPASNTPGSPLEQAAGKAGPGAIQAFSLLGNETRLAILLALWEAYEPRHAENAVSFSELQERVGVRDSGQFNYHLEKLVGHFVVARDDGYLLRQVGLEVVQTIISGTGLQEVHLRPFELDLSCHRCGAEPITLGYEDDYIQLICTVCEGVMSSDYGGYGSSLTHQSKGTLATLHLTPAGLANRTRPELLITSFINTRGDFQKHRAGVCSRCSGSVDSSLQVCDEHQASQTAVCPNCGYLDSVRIHSTCTVCKHSSGYPIGLQVLDHPSTVSFYREHGVDMRFESADVDRFTEKWELFWEIDHRLISTDPVRIRVTVPCNGDELRLMLDRDLNVIETSASTD